MQRYCFDPDNEIRLSLLLLIDFSICLIREIYDVITREVSELRLHVGVWYCICRYLHELIISRCNWKYHPYLLYATTDHRFSSKNPHSPGNGLFSTRCSRLRPPQTRVALGCRSRGSRGLSSRSSRTDAYYHTWPYAVDMANTQFLSKSQLLKQVGGAVRYKIGTSWPYRTFRCEWIIRFASSGVNEGSLDANRASLMVTKVYDEPDRAIREAGSGINR